MPEITELDSFDGDNVVTCDRDLCQFGLTWKLTRALVTNLKYK